MELNGAIRPEQFDDYEARPGSIGPVPRLDQTVTFVEGASFCVCEANGEIVPDRADGLFVRDTRLISRWQLRIDGKDIEPLSVIPGEPFEGRFIGRIPARPGAVEPTVLVERHRMVGDGMREDIVITNYGVEPAGLDLSLHVEADFADLFEVKDRRSMLRVSVESSADQAGLHFRAEHPGAEHRGVRITLPGADAVPGCLHTRVVVPEHGTWQGSVEVVPLISGTELAEPFPLDRPLTSTGPALRMKGWRAAIPAIQVDNPVLARALATSERDLGALRINDPEHPDDDVVAAGAPWFMALFGRDSLITSSLMLPFVPSLALGTLRTLARLQGTRESLLSEEQPGRILHEVRLGADLSLALGGQSVYYGSIDSTPLFVMVAGQALHWGVPLSNLAHLHAGVDAALDWIDRYGDRDGDGFVEYQRSTDRGLPNQGWKDSGDSVSDENGRLAEPPIALAEVQGYCYAAKKAGADLAEAFGHPDHAASLRSEAEALKQRFHEAFWLPEEGFYAMALDGHKRPMRVSSSNIGHCMWTGIVKDEVAGAVVDRLVAPDMFTGFGIRTLSSEAMRYNPASYHNGSVWPHDTVLAAAGMTRYGARKDATHVVDGLLDALDAFAGRLPELFCGFARSDKPVPVPYPTSCSPQAWAAATPFEILRISLDLEADVLAGGARAAAVPASIGRVRVRRGPQGSTLVDVDADQTGAFVVGPQR
ncbi:glycogen debranching N-terminal domain-containing protein [Propionibacterium sp.]|uniref:amylo-alpha-1,6-glucosidase n=1 Tax=Propionibacterium sp. TaxID=1977903 RepID=UPI0039E796D1